MPKKTKTNGVVNANAERKAKEREDRINQDDKLKENPMSLSVLACTPVPEKIRFRAGHDHEKQTKAMKQDRAMARRAELRMLAEEEQKQIEAELRKGSKHAKVTAAELQLRREEEEAAMKRYIEEEKNRRSRAVDEEEYGRFLNVDNDNVDADFFLDARNVDDALKLMNVYDEQPRMDFKEFRAAELIRLKELKPGLRLSQYDNMIQKKWKHEQKVAAELYYNMSMKALKKFINKQYELKREEVDRSMWRDPF